MNIKWNEYTWYSKFTAIILFIAVIPSWVFYMGMQYERTKTALAGEVTADVVSKFTSTKTEPESIYEFTYVVGATYAETKSALARSGWFSFMPDGKISAKDRQFPEIGGCGSGVDAICSVDFKNSLEKRHLNVQKGGRAGYTEWTVVGSE
jgi:hypothetical protein